MLNELHIVNLRSVDNINFKFKKLTIFTGLNSSGKSSVIGALTMLKQVEDEKINLTGDYVNFGTVGSAYRVDTDGARLKYSFEDGEEYIEISDEKALYNLSSDVSIENQLKNKNIGDRIRYLSSDRMSPNWTYKIDTTSYKNRNLGPKGENTVSYLCQAEEVRIAKTEPASLFIEELAHKSMENNGERNRLIPNINAWLSVISPGVSINAKHLKDINQSKLSFSSRGNVNEVSPFSVGFGLTHCLPIIVNILTAKRGDILIIENPELNLHPDGQIEIGKLMAKAASLGVQVIIETHSDHIVNAARLCLKDSVISNDDLEIKYLEIKKTDTLGFVTYSTKATTVEVDGDGKLREPPSGFFDTWKKSLMELL